MTMTDPIADMLTRLRNAIAVGHQQVLIPHSKIKEGIAAVLQREGFINASEVIERTPQGEIKVELKYGPDGEKIIRRIERVSKPGRRVYHSVGEITKVLNGLGISVYSTTKGILSDRECREKRVGGEALCTIW